MKRLAVFGAGGHTNEFKELSGLDFDIFVDKEWVTDEFNNIEDFDPSIWKIIVCIGDSKDRQKVVDKLPIGTEFFTYIHPTAIVGLNVSLGEGTYVGPYCIITTNAVIGKHALINRQVQISHDCIIGDFFSAMPGSTVSGNCTIGDTVYLGSNSSIRQKIKIYNNVKIGMGSTLVNNVETSGTYVGVPAKKKAKLSIIIPCYNFEKYIEQAIDSTLSQYTDFDIEVIVGDDKSTDNSYELIKNYDGKIIHYRNDENLGPYNNIKKMLEMANGKYISYLDGDDYFIDTLKSQKQVDFLESNPDYSMHSTGCFYGSEDGTPNYDALITPLYDTLNYYDLINTNYVSFGRTFRNYRKTIKEWMKDVYYLDWCFNLELSLMGKIKCESWPSGVYRITGAGMITSKTPEEVEILNNQCRELMKKRIEHYKYEL